VPRECRHDRFSRVADPAVLYWAHAVETTTCRRPVGGGHTAAGHGLVAGVLAVRFHRSACQAHAHSGRADHVPPPPILGRAPPFDQVLGFQVVEQPDEVRPVHFEGGGECLLGAAAAIP
jgi:hypothetical protein